MFKAIEALSKRFDSLGKNVERKLDLVNVNVMNMAECPQCATIFLCTTYVCNQPFYLFFVAIVYR